MEKGAFFSPAREYRYLLWRRWDPLKPTCAFVGLNPSTADESTDDPTIRRCLGYARDWGYGMLCMVNLFALRATDPRKLRDSADPVGPDNDYFLSGTTRAAELVVAAWGNHGNYAGRANTVCSMLGEVACLRVTKAGEPSHPLYLPKRLVPIQYVREAV